MVKTICKYRNSCNYCMPSATTYSGDHHFRHVLLFTKNVMMVTRVTFIVPTQWANNYLSAEWRGKCGNGLGQNLSAHNFQLQQ